MTDPWAEVAEEQIVAPRKARLRAAAERARNKALAERDQLYCLWQKAQQKRRAALLAGPFSDAATVLADFLERMTLDDAAALLALVKCGPWPRADDDTKYEVLAMIDRTIAYVRENSGLAPFDDALPGEDPTVFELVRDFLQ